MSEQYFVYNIPVGPLDIEHTAVPQEHFLVQEIAACSQHHTEVSLVTDWSPNLSFWSQMAAATHIAQPPPLPHEPPSPNHTYIALIASDGDSVQVCSCQYFSQPTLCRSEYTCLCLTVQLHDSLGQLTPNNLYYTTAWRVKACLACKVLVYGVYA